MRILLFLAILFPALASAQYAPLWQKYFDGPTHVDDRDSGMVVDSSGNIYVVGTVDGMDADANVKLIKYEPTGVVLWSKTIDGVAAGQDLGKDIALGGDGSVNIVARTLDAVSSDIMTVKYRASDGALQWSRFYDGPAHGPDDAFAVAADAQGNVYVAGEAWNNAEIFANGDYVTIKYDVMGTPLWAMLYDGPSASAGFDDIPCDLALDGNADLLVTGNSPDDINADCWATAKYDGVTGEFLWDARVSTSNNGKPVGLRIGHDNDVYVVGSQSVVTLIRYASDDGAPRWVKVDTFSHHGAVPNRFAFALDPNDNPALAVTFDPDTDSGNENDSIQTTKYSAATGNQLWSKSYGNSEAQDRQTAQNLISEPNGDILVVGLEQLGLGPVSTLLVKYSSAAGALLWSNTLAPPYGGGDAVRTLRDGAGNLVVAMNATGPSATPDMAVFKYMPTPLLKPVALTLTPNPAWGGSNPTVRVQLDNRPGTGGQAVQITENSSFVTTPSTVMVPKGALTTTFALTTTNPTYSQTVTVTARIGVNTVSRTFTLNKVAVKALALDSSTVQGGNGVTATVSLNGPAPSVGLVVSVTDNSVKVTTPSSVTVPSGLLSTTFAVSTLPVTSPVVCTIRAYSNGATGSATLTVNP